MMRVHGYSEMEHEKENDEETWKWWKRIGEERWELWDTELVKWNARWKMGMIKRQRNNEKDHMGKNWNGGIEHKKKKKIVNVFILPCVGEYMIEHKRKNENG